MTLRCTNCKRYVPKEYDIFNNHRVCKKCRQKLYQQDLEKRLVVNG